MNEFASAFDDDVINDLLASGADSYELKLVAIIDKHGKSLIQDFRQSFSQIKVTEAHYEDDVRIFIEDADVLLIECRVLEGFKDLKLINAARAIRPLIPIIAISTNLDHEFIVAAYESGVSDFVSFDISPELLLAKMRSIFRASEATRFMEAKNQELIQAMQSLRESKDKLKTAISSRINAETQKEFAQEVAAIHRQNKEILDNLHEGFFIIEKNLQIAPTTSAFCKKIFGKEIARKKFGSVLGILNEQEEFMALIVEQIFDNTMPLEVNLRMLPKQVKTRQGQILELIFTVIEDKQKNPDKIIVVAQDVTSNVLQQKKFQKQMDTVHTLFSILQNRDSFQEFLSDFKNDLDDLCMTRDRKVALRILHTIKGNVGVYSLDQIQKRIHAIESLIVHKKPDDKKFFAYMPRVAADLAKHLANFLKEHYKILNLNYDDNQQKSYKLEHSQLIQLETLAQKNDANSQKSLILQLKELHYQALSVLTAPYYNAVQRVSKKLQKEIDIQIEGDDLRTNIAPLSELFRSLVHIINNACDHGIENADRRADLQKPSRGQIKLNFTRSNDGELCITIQDDGSGLNTEKIKAIAIEHGILSLAAVQKLNEQEIWALIFADGFSTAETVSDTSGRGVGVSAVKSAVAALHGHIEIHSKRDHSCTFKIRIPNLMPKTKDSLSA